MGNGVVRPCYRLPGHVVMVLEEGERGCRIMPQLRNKRADVFCSCGFKLPMFFKYQLKHGHDGHVFRMVLAMPRFRAPQVGLLLDCLRCSAGQYLSDPCVWHMATCLRNNLGSRWIK